MKNLYLQFLVTFISQIFRIQKYKYIFHEKMRNKNSTEKNPEIEIVANNAYFLYNRIFILIKNIHIISRYSIFKLN